MDNVVSGDPGSAPSGETARTYAADDDDLRTSLDALAQLATAEMELPDVLTRVAEFAVAAIPGADGAGLTLMEPGRSDTIVASAPFVGEVDAIQYGIAEGPCISAAREGRTKRSGGLGADSQWPAFGRRVEELGVHSALSVPLQARDVVFGAMNIYARKPNAFDERAEVIGELFAVPAAIAVQNAQVLAQARRLAAELETALDSRAVIDRAVGILMSRVGCTAEEGFDRLRAMSQRENRKLRVIAEAIVDEAVGRARARRSQP